MVIMPLVDNFGGDYRIFQALDEIAFLQQLPKVIQISRLHYCFNGINARFEGHKDYSLLRTVYDSVFRWDASLFVERSATIILVSSTSSAQNGTGHCTSTHWTSIYYVRKPTLCFVNRDCHLVYSLSVSEVWPPLGRYEAYVSVSKLNRKHTLEASIYLREA